ncbi:hypothetical protein JK635_02565 [Neobacillus sp. YIM B02564]|uniref:Myb-like domain-containing protein n=1 Tax=Neobacillus paridis TaxID=2803862 RepID=A0ABS1TJB4_9BACI|nr:hypothetical protein [Neobacillus paridis]MBL4951124.1 hypothetical protein [Neobacillus paridis]
MRLIWTEEEEEILKKNYPTCDMDELLKILPRFTKEKIRIKACKLGIKRIIKTTRKENSKMVRWNDEEIELLKKVYKHSTNDELLQLFPRFDLRRIRYKARTLGLEKSNDIKNKDKEEQVSKMLGDSEWTDEEVKILIENYELMGGKGLTKLLPNRTRLSITSKASKMGLTTEREARWVNTGVKFSNEDIFSIQVTFERVDR